MSLRVIIIIIIILNCVWFQINEGHRLSFSNLVWYIFNLFLNNMNKYNYKDNDNMKMRLF